jgi:hypothetical protein
MNPFLSLFYCFEVAEVSQEAHSLPRFLVPKIIYLVIFIIIIIIIIIIISSSIKYQPRVRQLVDPFRSLLSKNLFNFRPRFIFICRSFNDTISISDSVE